MTLYKHLRGRFGPCLGPRYADECECLQCELNRQAEGGWVVIAADLWCDPSQVHNFGQVLMEKTL